IFHPPDRDYHHPFTQTDKAEAVDACRPIGTGESEAGELPHRDREAAARTRADAAGGTEERPPIPHQMKEVAALEVIFMTSKAAPFVYQTVNTVFSICFSL